MMTKLIGRLLVVCSSKRLSALYQLWCKWPRKRKKEKLKILIYERGERRKKKTIKFHRLPGSTVSMAWFNAHSSPDETLHGRQQKSLTYIFILYTRRVIAGRPSMGWPLVVYECLYTFRSSSFLFSLILVVLRLFGVEHANDIKCRSVALLPYYSAVSSSFPYPSFLSSPSSSS